MLMRMRWAVVAGVLVGLATVTAAGDDLASVEKRLQAAWEKHKSMACKMKSTGRMTLGDSTAETMAEGTCEYLRKEGKTQTRLELKTAIVQKVGEEEMKMDQEVLLIVDGQHQYTLASAMGQKMAMKSDIDPQFSGEPKALFAQLHKDSELKLLPEETIDGRKTFVVEATPKATGAKPFSRSLSYFDQEHGVLLKSVQYDASGAAVQTSTYTDVKIDVDIDPQRFVFKLPEGVPLMDQTKKPGATEEPAAPE